MINQSKLKILSFVILIVFAVSSCKSNEASNQNKNEVIKLLVYNPTNMIIDNIYERIETDKTLFNSRDVIFKNFRKLPLKYNGLASCAICINQKGKVIFSKILKEESTIKENIELYKFLKASTGYVYSKLERSNNIQCGRLIFSIKNFKK